jgi:membrane-bound lytic murein transglycosylase B
MRLPATLLLTSAVALLGACASNPPAGSTAGSPTASAPDRTPSLLQAAPPAPAPKLAARVAAPVSSLERYRSTALAGDYGGYPAARRVIDRLVKENGFDRDYLNGVFSRIERQQWILDFMNRPSPPPAKGPTGRWTRYRSKFLTPEMIAKGVRFWREHADTLERAQARYGVAPEYVVAIIGIESHFGANVGRTTVINALATLAFDYPRRADYFSDELKEFLVMTQDQGFDPFEPVGSYAGAMGLGQFMPSSFHRFAVDFDGDGRRDLWNPVDAIGSVANYFKEQGWRSGEPVAVSAQARGSAPRALQADYRTRYDLDTLAGNGVTTRHELDGAQEVSLLRLDALGGYEYWLGLHNFYVITRYNHSTYYAMAVYQLARAVHERASAIRLVSLDPWDDADGNDLLLLAGAPYSG